MNEYVWIEPDFRCEFGTNVCIGGNVNIVPGGLTAGNPCRII